MLAEFIQNQDLQGKRVIELGAGLGLCGFVAGCCGASEVLLTDIGEHVDLMRENIKANEKLFHGGAIMKAEELWWGDDLSPFGKFDFGNLTYAKKELSHHTAFSHTHTLSLSSSPSPPPPPSSFCCDIVLGAEITYDDSAFLALVKTIKSLCRHDTKILIAHQFRLLPPFPLFCSLIHEIKHYIIDYHVAQESSGK